MDIESADQLLTTTRSVRRRLDLSRAVEPEVIERCLEVAAQAPSGSDRQKWHFVVVADQAKRLGLAELYRSSFWEYAGTGASSSSAAATPLAASAIYLAEHFHEVPVLVLFCYEGRAERDGVMGQASMYGSILPAAWSFMLALRARGLGSAWTTLHLRYEREAAALLGLPDSLTQAALIPVAYATGGDFRPAKRRPVQEVTHWDGWGRRRGE